MSSQDFTKLTVSQLQALCRDKKLAGYSKLSKAALVEKLISSTSNPARSNTSLQSHSGQSFQAPAELANKTLVRTVSEKRPASDQIDVPAKRRRRARPAKPSVQNTGIQPPLPLKNFENVIQPAPQALKDRVWSYVPLATLSANTLEAPELPAHAAAPESIPLKRKHFKPVTTTAPPTPPKPNDFPLRHLEFNPSPSLSLEIIKMPPCFSQRRNVQPWAIILAGLSNAERRQCALVSKTIRYAVYMSATLKLDKDFSGNRLDEMINHLQTPTNMWPFLRMRQQEVLLQRSAYKHSFLGDFYQGFEPISPRLWKSPDNSKQYEIALRFTTTRLWFEGCSRRDASRWPHVVVTDAQQVVENKLWAISVFFPETASTHICYVLASTGQIIKGSTSAAFAARAIKTPSRAGWSDYIDQASSPCSLMDHVTWVNHEEYDRGINRLWLKHFALQVAKRTVAERYIIARIVANMDIASKNWIYVNLVAQPNVGESSSKERVNLILSERWYVESVHFTTSNGQPLHAALAVIQTSEREYYVLKDNGMPVGYEKGGVSPIWMKLLRCDSMGVAV